MHERHVQTRGSGAPLRRRRHLVVGVVAVVAVATAACGNTTEDTLPAPTTTAAPTSTTTALPAPTSTTRPPVTGALAIEGDLVRDAPATAVATGLPPGQELTLVVSDAGQRIPVGYVTPAPDGTARVQFVVPSAGMHEGICVDDGPCEYRPVELGAHRLSLSHSANDLTGALTVDIEIVPARRNIAYPARVTGECGPVRTHADGRTWIADTPERFDAPGEPDLVSLNGMLTITGARTAVFRAEDGRTGRFTEGPRYYC